MDEWVPQYVERVSGPRARREMDQERRLHSSCPPWVTPLHFPLRPTPCSGVRIEVHLLGSHGAVLGRSGARARSVHESS